MKVMHIITGLSRGGAEGAMLRLVLSDRENDHTVVSLMDRGVHAQSLEARGIPVHVMGMRRSRITLSGLVRLYRLISEIQPDVIQTWMYHADLVGGIVGKLAGRRAIVWGIRHSSLDRRKTSLTTQLVARGCAVFSWRIPSAVAICSQQAIHVHGELGFQTDKFVVIANGFDARRFQPNAGERSRIRAEIGADADEFLIGMVARWDPQKDHATLLAALAHELVRGVGGPRCALIGPGIDASNSALLALLHRHGLGDRVLLLGDRPDVESVMNALDLHVLSSAYGEGFPNVVAEAMATEVPAVVTDVGDSALIVGETGWLVPPSNVPELARAIREATLAARDAESWLARKRASRERIIHMFSMEQMVNNYRELWRRTLAGEVERVHA